MVFRCLIAPIMNLLLSNRFPAFPRFPTWHRIKPKKNPPISTSFHGLAAFCSTTKRNNKNIERPRVQPCPVCSKKQTHTAVHTFCASSGTILSTSSALIKPVPRRPVTCVIDVVSCHVWSEKKEEDKGERQAQVCQ